MTVIETKVRSLQQLQSEQREASRGEFCDAVWNAAPPTELAMLANRAAMEGDAADKLHAEIENALRLVPIAADLPKRQKAFRAAESKETKLAVEVEQLETRLAELFAEAEGLLRPARAGVDESEQAATTLLGMHSRDPVAMPIDRLPDVARKKLEQHAAELAEQQQHADRAARSNRIKEIESELAQLRQTEDSTLRVRKPAGLADAGERYAKLEAKLEAMKSNR